MLVWGPDYLVQLNELPGCFGNSSEVSLPCEQVAFELHMRDGGCMYVMVIINKDDYHIFIQNCFLKEIIDTFMAT